MLLNSLSALLNQCAEHNPDVLFFSIGGKNWSVEQRFPTYLDNYKGKVLSILIDLAYQNIKEALTPYDNFIGENNIYRHCSRESYVACCNAKLPEQENTPERQQLRDYFNKLLDSGKTIVIADHSINFPACCSLVLVGLYNDLKIHYKDKIQMYIQAGGGATMYLNENLFFPISPYSFTPNNLIYARQMVNTYKGYYEDNLNFSQHIDYLIRLSKAHAQRVTEQFQLPEYTSLSTNEERDNWLNQHRAIVKKSHHAFNVSEDCDYYPNLCIQYGFIPKQKKWTLEAAQPSIVTTW
jgi:hypothetical protein